MKADRNTVVVVNAENFLGVNLIKACLQRNMKVKAIVRNSAESAYLSKDLIHGEENLSIYETHLYNVDQLVDIFGDAAGLFFIPRDRSMPGIKGEEEVYRQVINPSKKDLITVLEAARKSKRIQRVVFNSSMSSVMFQERAFDEEVRVSGDDWSSLQYLRQNKKWYYTMITETEKAGWQFMDAPHNVRFTFVTVHPGSIVGPLFPGVKKELLPSSMQEILSMINGEIGAVEDRNIPMTDIRDLVAANLMLYDRWTLHGRFPVVSQCVPSSELVKIVKQCESSADIPQSTTVHAGSKAPVGRLIHVNCDNLERYGFHFRSVTNSISDMCRSFRYHQVYEPSTISKEAEQ
eukprot:gb/GECH01014431.1/.p1 GENE.gb/GECH01014431.1/~~gb/GECH01014431.1/.p1  ORF type:complete len:348 (+),score=101.67 gb/GECH01014431.1/:1-1044(+)